MSTQNVINLIEPTLQSEAGHCAGYARTLLRAAQDRDVNVKLWVGKNGAALFDNVDVQGIFTRRLRKLQTFLLYRQLLRSNEKIFVPTAGRIDLQMLDFLLGNKTTDNIFLHFHQFKVSPKKIKQASEIAKRHSAFNILAPTQALVDTFRSCGFSKVTLVPCPTYQNTSLDKKSVGFKHVLYAGAARADKGFADVVDLVELAANQKLELPFLVQVSQPYSGRYDELTQAALDKLSHICYSHLLTEQNALTAQQYQAQFVGGICLLAYDQAEYADKFSGVALDAFYAGCPIVTVSHTWMGNTVKRFDAGIVIDNVSAEALMHAVNVIKNNYGHYQKNAWQAGEILREEHDPKHTIEVLV